MKLSAAEARRVALAAHGFDTARPAKAGLPHVRRLASRLGAFQIDSVNVLVRAHYMPAFSRLGPYPMTAIDSLAYDKRELFEFWGHAACYMPVALYPYFRWRMDCQLQADHWTKAEPRVKRYVEAVYSDVAERGPLGASEVKGAGKAKGNWWGWSDGKRAIETLYRQGRVAISGRRGFERLYDIRERVIPKSVLEAPTPPPDDAKKHLLLTAARALGVATAGDIAGYYHVEQWWDRQPVDGKRFKSNLPRLFKELIEAGELVPATVDGWDERAFVLPKTKVPTNISSRALLSPFDPVMWQRAPVRGGHRPRRVFGFDYTIEIYVPEPKRIYGYYCLPFLLGDALVARVDLKADRKRSVLMVPGAFAEPGPNANVVAAELTAELREMADWLGLERIEVGDRGDLSSSLRKAFSRRTRPR